MGDTKLSLDICRQIYRGCLALLTTIDEKERLAADLEAANAGLERREAERRETEAAVTGLRAELTHVRSEEHTSELQSLMRISYAVFCLKKKKKIYINRRVDSTTRTTI